MTTCGSLLWITAECPAPTDAEDGHRRADAALGGGDTRDAEHRAELLVGERLLVDREVERRDQDAGATRDADAAFAAIAVALLPTREVSKRPCGNSVSRTRSRSAGSSTWAPWRSISLRNRSATDSSTISTLSLVHSTELSNALLVTSFPAARGRSALASTSTGTLPGPTPIAGLPEE
jgi:hypothetical protein